MDDLFLLDFFASIGEGIWYIQNVEDALNVYILIKYRIKKPGSLTKGEGERILERYRRNTLGTSLKIITENKLFSTPLLERLKKFKKERDWLVHRIVYQNRKDLYSKKEKWNLLKRIKFFVSEAKVLQKIISNEIEDYSIALGVDPKLITKESQRILSKMAAEES